MSHRQPLADVPGVQPPLGVLGLPSPVRVLEVSLEHTGAFDANLALICKSKD